MRPTIQTATPTPKAALRAPTSLETRSLLPNPQEMTPRPHRKLCSISLNLAPSPDAPVKLGHEGGGALGVDLPLARHRRASPADEQRPRHADQALPSVEGAPAGLAPRQHHHVGVQIEAHHLPR